MKRAVEKEQSETQRSKRFRFAEADEELLLPSEIEAQSYLISVKEHFKDDKEKYAEFIQIINDFTSEICDTIGVITRLKQLFKSHKLLLSFNKFLPKGFEILFPSKEFLRKDQQVQYEEALTYIKKVKRRFQNEEYMHKGFLQILNTYMKGSKPINDIYKEVKLLFCDHQDLIDEFTCFLPASTSSALVPHLQDFAMLSSEPTLGLTSIRDSHKEDMGKQGQKYFTLNNNCHQSSQFALKKDVEGTSVAVVNEHSKKGEKEKELKEGWQLKEEDRGEKRPAQNMESELYVMDQHSHRSNLTLSSDDLFVRQRQMGSTDYSTGKHSQQGPHTDHSKISSSKSPQQLDFFEKVKTNIGNIAYQEIVKSINMYNKKLINSELLQRLAGCILGKYPEIVDEFNEIISQSTNGKAGFNLGEEECTKHVKKGKGNEKEKNFDNVLEKENERPKEKDREENERKKEKYSEEDRDGHKDQHHKSIVLEKENEKQKEKDSEEDRDRHKDQYDKSRVLEKENEREKEMDSEEDRDRHKDQHHKSRAMLDSNAPPVSNNEKITYNPISEIHDLSHLEQCTPNYGLLPQNFMKPIDGHKDQHHKSRVPKKENERKKEKDSEEDTDGHKDQHHKSRAMLDSNASPVSNNEKITYKPKPISEMDLSHREQCTSSYGLLPQNFMKPIDGHKDQHHKSRVPEKENERKKEKDSEEDTDGHKDQHHKSRTMLDSNASPVSNNEKITDKPISEMDLSHREQCTPSYRLLPQNLVKPIDGHKDQHHNSRVLEKENERKKEKNSEEDRDKDQHHTSRAMLDNNASPVPKNEEITYKPISEMDFSHWEQCTPSYRLLPQNFVKPIASYSTDLGAEVLNDICVSVVSGTEDYSKQMRMNPYEEAIFKCEDDRFELDVLIENVEAAIKRIHELQEKKHDNITQRSADFRIEKHLTAMNLRCIELIYGDYGLYVIDLLRENPDRCLPVIVKRLQQKHDEWVNCRTRFNIGWADVYVKNHKRSLDHHSSCSKQRDTKSLSQKRMRTHFHL